MRSRKANIDTTFTSHFFFLLLVLFPLINVCTKKQTNPLLLCIVRSDEGTQGKRKMGKFGNVMHKIIIISHEHCYMHAAIFCVDYYRGLCLKQSHTGLLFIHASSNRSLFFFFFLEKGAACLVYARMYARIAPHCGRNHNAEKRLHPRLLLPQRLRPHIIFRH